MNRNRTVFYYPTVALAGLLAYFPICLAGKEPSEALSLARQLNQAFIEVAENVSPAVVVITVTQKPSDTTSEEGAPYDALPRGLRPFFRGTPDHDAERAPRSAPTGQGSGIVIRPDGYILTNRHVVENANKIEVRFKDGETYKGEIRGVDQQSDLAVIKIDATGLPVARLGDSAKTRVGEFAVAIGAPFDLDYSVTYGHISAKGRKVVFDSSMMDQDFIQTDASINPGNSGGPLVNIDSEVIGINTLIKGLHTGIGFAIPSNLAREISDRLISDGKFTRVWLGVHVEALSARKDVAAQMPDVKGGVVVVIIDRDGPAAKSRLEPQDVITGVDAKPVVTPQDLRDETRSKKPGQTVALDVLRDGKSLKISVQLDEVPGDRFVTNRGSRRSAANASKGLGFTVSSITRELADEYGVDRTDGVIVTDVEDGSLAAEHEIKPGDIITKIDHAAVANLREFRAAMKSADPRKGVAIVLSGETGKRFEIIKDSGD